MQNADITLTDCRVSEDARLQNCNSFADVAKVLKGTRNTVAWASAGHGVAAYDIALNYAQRRTQFGRPIAKNQMIQSVLVEMLGEVTAMQLYCIRLGRLIDDGKMSDTMASLAKYFCSVKARHVCRLARDVLTLRQHAAIQQPPQLARPEQEKEDRPCGQEHAGRSLGEHGQPRRRARQDEPDPPAIGQPLPR